MRRLTTWAMLVGLLGGISLMQPAAAAPSPRTGDDIRRGLALFWHEGRGDNYTSSTSEGNISAKEAGYTLARIEGWGQVTQDPGTVQLRLYWHASRQDNFSTATSTGARSAEEAGYTFVRVEAYVFAHQVPGTVPLRLYWSESRQDNLTIATLDGIRSADEAGYTFVRIEGYVYPYPYSTYPGPDA